MYKWLKDIWINYTKFVIKNKSILILDNATSHKTTMINNELKKVDSELIMIPGGLTSKL